MCVGSKKLTLVLLMAAALLLPSVASAQSGSAQTSEWSSLSAVASGSKLVVRTKGGKSFEGRLSGVTDAALSLSIKDRPVEFKREDVQSVYRVGKNSAAKGTLIGMGVGAGAGLAIGAAGSASSDGFDGLDHAITAGLTVVGAGVGAGVGYLIGRRGGKRVLVYEAGRP
jgi:hypothetical protein